MRNYGWGVFNEVFFDAVEVPLENLVGEENHGWTIAKSLLEFERLKLARIGENKRRRARARELGLSRTEAGQRLAERPWFRQRFAELDMRLLALEANAARFIEWAQADYPVGVEVSMLKMRGSRLIQLWEELSVNALGPEALTLDPAALAPGGPRPARRTASRPRPRHGAFWHVATPLPAVPARSSTTSLPSRYSDYEHCRRS